MPIDQHQRHRSHHHHDNAQKMRERASERASEQCNHTDKMHAPTHTHRRTRGSPTYNMVRRTRWAINRFCCSKIAKMWKVVLRSKCCVGNACCSARADILPCSASLLKTHSTATPKCSRMMCRARATRDIIQSLLASVGTKTNQRNRTGKPHPSESYGNGTVIGACG